MIKSIQDKKKKKGFTLVELVAVIAIIGILAAVLVPKILGYVQESRKVEVVDQARKVVIAGESVRIKTGKTEAQMKAMKASEIAAAAGELLDSTTLATTIDKLGSTSTDALAITYEECTQILDSEKYILKLKDGGVFDSVTPITTGP